MAGSLGYAERLTWRDDVGGTLGTPEFDESNDDDEFDDENDDENDDKDDEKKNARVPRRVFSLRDMGVRVVYSERFRKGWGSVDADGAV